MLSLFIFVILIFNAATQPDNEIVEIHLNYNSDMKSIFIAWVDEPMKIIIDYAFARRAWCMKYYTKSGGSSSSELVPDTEFSNNTVFSILNIPKVTAEMSTRWSCTVLQEYHEGNAYLHKNHKYTARNLQFNLYVKGARRVILTANHQILKYDVKTNLSVEYNGVANYIYKDGEDVEFSCKKAKNDTHLSDSLRLEYFNAKGIPLLQTEPGKKLHIFRTVLNFTNDKYYLDCICTSTDPFREYRYRTTFYMKEDAEQHAIKLYINGQRLTTLSNNYPTVDNYIFRYIDGEVLNITCEEIHSLPKGNIHFNFDRMLNYREDRSDQKMGIIRLRLLASNVNNKTLTCGISDTQEHIMPIVRLLFLSDVPDNGVRVRGLPRNNVLYQYTHDLGPWTIRYQYSVNDTLSLTCVAKSVNHRMGLRDSLQFKRMVGGLSIASPANWKQALPTIKTSEYQIMENLNESHNGTKINCAYLPMGTSDSYNNKTVEIILQLKPNQSEIVNETNSSEVDTGETPTYGSKSNTLLYYVSGVGAVVIVIILVVLYYKIIKKRCCVRSSVPIPAPIIDPASVYYENLLAVFQPINEREAAGMEDNQYEEIE